MRLILLYSLFYIGLAGCASIVKETTKGTVATIVDDFEEYDLSEATDEALAVGKANGTSSFTYVGLGLFTIGAVMFATVMRDSGLKLMACGALAGSVPYIVQSAYFSIIVSGALLISLLIGIYYLWSKAKQSENADSTEQP